MLRRGSLSVEEYKQLGIGSAEVSQAVGGYDQQSSQDQKAKLKLEARLPFYQDINPFLPTLPFTCYERLKIFLFCITLILPIKLILLVCCVLSLYFWSLLLTIGRERTSAGHLVPCSLWRRPFEWMARLSVRTALFFWGFYWIPVIYEGAGFGDGCCDRGMRGRPITVVPNHVCMFDGFIMFALTGGVPVAKREMRDLPMLGRIMDAFGTVWVDRRTGQGRKGARQLIRNYQS